MKKLCIIGNSHVAAMRNSWRTWGQVDLGFDAEFYAYKDTRIESEVTLKNGELTIEGAQFWCFKTGSSDQQCSAVPLAGFDSVILTGLGFGPECVVKLYKRYGYFGLNGRRPQVISRDMFKSAASDALNDTAAIKLATAIKQESGHVPFLVPSPFPSERGFSTVDRPAMVPWRLAVENGDIAELIAMYDELKTEVLATSARLINQPETTKANAYSTLKSFSENAATTLNERLRRDDDFRHMNDHYGIVMWKEIRSALADQVIV